MMHSGKVAVIGGGPAGLTALKSLLDDGLQAVLFEQSAEIGGQWNQPAGHSGVWESLHTNSSRYVTVFSDFPHRANVQLYPGHSELWQYLKDYRDHFHLAAHIRLNTRVQYIDRAVSGGYSVCYTTKENSTRCEKFSHVVVAPGRFSKPHLPVMPGLGDFKGTVIHSFDYRNNAAFNGRKVLVVGDRISGLEIASDLSRDESIAVISSSRKPKYILTRLINGLPADHLLFNRFRYLASQAFPPAVNAERFKQFVLKACGNPADFGGLRPSENIFEAGISACQHYLERVRDKRIAAKGAVKQFTANGVVFDDNTEMNIDAIVFATGYDLHLPFLDKQLFDLINSGDQHLDLFNYTFHPDLPDMAFIGLYMQIGPKFPSFELQARWVAGCWSGHIPLPDREAMRTGIEAFRASKKWRDAAPSQEMILLFAKAAGVEPELDKFPELAGSLLFGPLVPSQFRLQGHGKKENAKEMYLANNAGAPNALWQLSPQQLQELKEVARSLKDNLSLQKIMEEG